MARGAVAVHGFRELNQTFKHAPKETRREIREEYRTVAEPVRVRAEARAVLAIPNIGSKWSKMRTGVTQSLVYVAPVQRGIKTRGPGFKRRPNLANLLKYRALEPALAANRHLIEAHFDEMLDRLVAKWGSRV